jgi:hypothetical protein
VLSTSWSTIRILGAEYAVVEYTVALFAERGVLVVAAEESTTVAL